MSDQQTRCKADVRTPGHSFYRPKKCARAAVKDGYCAQHHPDAKEARLKKAMAAHDAKVASSPYATIARLAARVRELEGEIERIRALSPPVGRQGGQS